MIRATIWNKARQRASREGRGALDLEGLHTAIADGVHALVGNDVQLRTAIPYQHEQGLPEALLAGTDVLVWWGHAAHQEITDATVACVRAHVLAAGGTLRAPLQGLQEPYGNYQ